MTATGARVNHAQVEAYVRRYARFNMRNTVRITRPTAPVFDPDTGSLASAGSLIVYEGPARIYTVQGPLTYSLGDEPQRYSSTFVSIPVTDDSGAAVNIPRIEDVIEVLLAPGDSNMVGRTFQVQDVEAGGQWMAARRLQVAGIQASKQWGTT